MVDKVGNITDNPTGRQVERQTGISSASSNCLKGIFAICVLIHHLYQGSGLLHDTVIGGVLQLRVFSSYQDMGFMLHIR